MITVVAIMLFVCHTYAATPENLYKKGCDLYSKNEFRAAAHEFEEAAKSVESSDIYYNLGNCHYRLNDYPKARLAFERAIKIDPSNQDAKYNLRLVVAKINSSGIQSQSFISSWTNDFVHSRSISQWAICALTLFAMTLVFALLYILGNTVRLRKIAFFAALACMFATAISFVCAGIQTHGKDIPSEAIVIRQSDVRQSPSANSKALQQILPGSKIKLIKGTMLNGWQQISLGDGQKGWISTHNIGII